MFLLFFLFSGSWFSGSWFCLTGSMFLLFFLFSGSWFSGSPLLILSFVQWKGSVVLPAQLSLNGEWQFFPDPARTLTAGTLDHAIDRRTIEVPAPWQAAFADLRQYTGVAWYRRIVHAPALQPGQTLLLYFGAVDYHATVWLNGTLLGEHEGGYLPFQFTLDGAVRAGENELVVRVNDPGSDYAACPEFPFQEVPHGKQSWYGPIGGIWQAVWLEVRPVCHIRRLHMTPHLAEQTVDIDITFSSPLPEAGTLLLALNDPTGKTITTSLSIQKNTATLTHQLSVPAPLAWSPDSPQLYMLTATLHNNGFEDRVSDTFGMRSIVTGNGQLLLNGKPFYLRGALDQDYYPDGIYTPFSDAELERQFQDAKAMGLNCLRTHIKITDPRYYAAADRVGLLIWTELPNWELLTPRTSERARATLLGMVERDWNHPSIMIWTIVNENWGTDLMFNAEHRQWLRDTYAMLKARDPYRLVVGNSACYGNFHVVTDIEDFHNYYAIPDHADQWQRWVESFAGRAGWSFAHTIEGKAGWDRYVSDPWTANQLTATSEVLRRGDEPIIVSEFGNWGLPNVELLYQHYGGEPWWFETGYEWGQGVVYPHGIERRFTDYGLAGVFNTLGELSATSQRMQFLALKYEIEEMRRHASIQGYVITEFTDVHWECNGLLDMCRNRKVFFDDLRWLNADTVLLPAVADGRVAFWGGEECTIVIDLAHHAAQPLQNATLRWELAGSDLHGDIPLATIGSYTVGTLASFTLTLPDVSQSEQRRLTLALTGVETPAPVRNYVDLYSFPRQLATPPDIALWTDDAALRPTLQQQGYIVRNEPDAIRIVTTLTDADRAFVQSGGRVIWLADSDGAQQTVNIGMQHLPRKGHGWQGDWASSLSWLRRDGAMAAIPTGGVVDWAFAGMTPDHVLTGLPPRDYAGDVWAGLFVGWLHHHAALIAERRIGAGQLVGCTFRIREHLGTQPVATVLLHAMLGRLKRA